MPFTVTCPACSSRFSLGDDLYRRKVVGNLITVKCRQCSAEIAVDATEPVTLTGQDAPRRAPSPPRPKGASVTRMGLGPAPAAATLVSNNATGTPLPLDATVTPFPQGVGATPRGPRVAPKTAIIEPASIWDDSDETVQINAPKLEPAPVAKLRPVPHLPRAPHPPRKVKEEEPELIEAEEIPASSSDAPTLDALRLEGPHPNLPPGKRAPDDFLVNLSAGTQGILGAPTIDVSSLDAAPPLSVDRIDVDVDIVEEDEVEPVQPQRAARSGTMPLFDMSAVLPAAGAKPKATDHGGAGKALASDSPASVSLPAPESKSRERKYVVAPNADGSTTASASASAPKPKRAGAAVWFGLVAVAAGVVAVVGLRGHPPEARVTTEPTQAPTASEAPKVAAAEPPPLDSAATQPPSAPTSEPSAAPPVATSIAAAVSPTNANANAKREPEPALEKPVVSAETAPPTTSAPTEEKPGLEKPTTPSKPVEAHNAPPPAADGTEFDRAAARSALASAASEASACRKDGDPSGTATITITFAPSGRITSANLQGPPFAGTATGGCIANTMRHATVPAFSGEHVTVTKTIVVQ